MGRTSEARGCPPHVIFCFPPRGAAAGAPMRIAFTRIPEPEVEEIDRSYARRLKKPARPAPPEPEAG